MPDIWHDKGIEIALQYLRGKGLDAKPEYWVFITSPNGISRSLHVDVAGFHEEELVEVIEIGGISSPWYFALSLIIRVYHWPLLPINSYGRPKHLATSPHLFGHCVNCPPIQERGFRIQSGDTRKAAMGILEQIE